MEAVRVKSLLGKLGSLALKFGAQKLAEWLAKKAGK